MNSMMAGVIREGTGKAARLDGWQAAGKSGTTQNSRDALFVGFTSVMATGVWFGNDDGSYMKKVTGGTLPARAWKEYMTVAMKGYTPTPLFGFNNGLVQPAQPQEQSPSTSIGDIISGILPGSGQSRQNSAQDSFPPAPQAPGQEAILSPSEAPNPASGQAPRYPAPAQAGLDPAQRRYQQPTQQQPYPQAAPQPPGAVPCAYGDNAVCNNANGNTVYSNRPARQYRDGGNSNADQAGGYRDYRQYRGQYDSSAPVPPGSVGGGPLPPGEVGADGGQVYQPQQTRRTTLLDVIMGQ
jgi:penicillin-binding protein 1A